MIMMVLPASLRVVVGIQNFMVWPIPLKVVAGNCITWWFDQYHLE